MSQPDQFDLFAADAPPPPANRTEPAPVPPELRRLAARLPSSIQLGTSSWSFPGWEGIVFAGATDKQRLAKTGLEAYAHHPLLRAVGVDRTFYAPVTATTFAGYLGAVPEDFYFVVKAHQLCTSPVTLSYDGRPQTHNPRFLDPDFALEHVLAPLFEGLGAERATLLLQFPPMSRHLPVPARATFPDNLHRFLDALPKSLAAAVELRDAELFTPEYLGALGAAGASHCINIHPRAAPLAAQLAVHRGRSGAPTVVRWMLGSGLGYEAARRRYHPFDRLVDPDPVTRAAVARKCLDVCDSGHRCVVIANNKAEGSAPLTLVELANEIVSRRG